MIFHLGGERNTDNTLDWWQGGGYSFSLRGSSVRGGEKVYREPEKRGSRLPFLEDVNKREKNRERRHRISSANKLKVRRITK